MVKVAPPRIGADLVAWLKQNYPARVVGATEDLITIHRYSAQVELAQRLIRMGSKQDDPESMTLETD